jgi:(S)-sulfolactate dehydrogenase
VTGEDAADSASPPSPTAVIPEYLPDPHLEMLAERLTLVYDPDLYAERPRLLAEVSSAHAILIRNRTVVDTEFLRAAPRLVVVGRLGVGLDNIDMEAAAAAGVKVIPARGGNAVAVAEYVMGAMLNLHRGVFGMTSSMVAGEWPRQGHAFGNELKDKTLGLVGFGAIAREVAKRGRALEMTIVAHDPLVPDDDPAWDLVDRVGLDCLLARSDVVSLHVPLTEETRHLVSEEAISKLKRGTILVNTSRGGVVDQEAVAAALHDGRLGGAALDVFETEPLGPGSGSVFAGLSNVILTPHLAGNTHEAVDRIATMTVESVLRELRLA